MPTYEYICEKCGHSFELFQRMTEEPEKECPECNGPVRRVIGAGAGLLFKGEGFYITDYRSKDYQDKAKAEKSAADPASKPKEKSDKKDSPKPKSDSSKAGKKKDSGG